MSITLAPIRGTVSITIAGGGPATLATFEVPVTMDTDEHGVGIISAAPTGAILTAAADALREAAERMLADVAPVEELRS